MRRTRLLTPFMALIAPLALVCVLLLATPGASAHPLDDPATTIAGVVVNGTHGSVPVAGQSVVLQVALGSQARDIATTTSDAQGRFIFANVDGTTLDTFAVYTRFQGGTFPSAAIRLGDPAAQQVTLTLYDVTQSDANLRIASASLLVRQPRPVNGLVGVGEFVTIRNTGTTAFVGAATPVNGDPRSLLRFALPPAASGLVPGLGFSGARIVQIGTGFAATATVPPGATQFAFAYDLPYQGTQLALPYKGVYPTDTVLALLPPDLRLSQPDFVARGEVSVSDGQYQVYQHGKLDALAPLTITVAQLPRAGQPPSMDARVLAAVGGLLALVLALLLVVYLRRGQLAVALGLAPAVGAATLLTNSATVSAEACESERQRLLRALLALETARARGEIGRPEFERRSRELRGELRALLAGSGAPVEQPSPATATGVAGETASAPAPTSSPSATGGNR